VADSRPFVIRSALGVEAQRWDVLRAPQSPGTADYCVWGGICSGVNINADANAKQTGQQVLSKPLGAWLLLLVAMRYALHRLPATGCR
jgi:hypothetical protein